MGLLKGKFCQFFTELSALDTTMAGYYSLKFLFALGGGVATVLIFSSKTYVVDTHKKFLDKELLLSTTTHLFVEK